MIGNTASTGGSGLESITFAAIPASASSVFGPEGARPEHFRFSRSRRCFILNEEKLSVAAAESTDRGFADNPTPGILQQVDLCRLPRLLEEIAYLDRSNGDVFKELRQLLARFEAEGYLPIVDLGALRESLEGFLARRPTGVHLAVRSGDRHQSSFLPHHHPHGIWFQSKAGQIGADIDGIFFLDERGREYFRSHRFLQRNLSPGRFSLEDPATGAVVESPIAVSDVFYANGSNGLQSEVLSEVILESFEFTEELGRFALQLHSLAKMGLVMGQPALRLVCENTRYIAFEH